VIRHLGPDRDDWQRVFSYFSPSAEPLARRLPVDRADYLPYDTRPNVDAMIEALQPRALVFTKLDLWPELATRAHARGVRVGMVAATVSPVSGRLNPMARALTRSGYAALDRVGAIDQPDAGRLVTLGVLPDRIVITGDPRFDSAARRAAAIAADNELVRLTAGGAAVVAGSTWSEDEEVLLAAFLEVRIRHPEARLVIVPHEPRPGHLARLERRISGLGLGSARLSTLPGGAVPNLVVVDQVGVLASLYPGARLAYVGGGFGTAGLHSVLEPAACGVPVVFGPRWQSSREAGLLLAAKAGQALAARRGTVAAAEMAALWSRWLAEPEETAAQGRRAAEVVNRELGAAARSAALVTELMAP
jgi:3-deoxy-D-manno-octulosonic-acid transferase